MRRLVPIVLLAVIGTTCVAPPALASRPTARASGVQAIYSVPGGRRVVDRLAKNERVYVDECTRRQRWCRVTQLDGGPSGWVRGSDLVGSPAKNLVTPFEFTFDPMDPLDLFHRRH